MKNVTASIQGKLKVIAQAEGKAYQLILTRYFQERLLFRIFLSSYSRNFCLKGGALLYAIGGEKSRPTLDIDLLGIQISNDEALLQAVFNEICSIPYLEDGVGFELGTLATSEINKEGNYPGIRVKIVMYLGNIRQVMQVDIGFGDQITPGPVQMEYPTLLEMPCPEVQAYSIETVMAEKFEAMIDLAEMNSRMKDFYDLYRLLNGQHYDQTILAQAIAQTFHHRHTIYQKDHPIFSEAFAGNEKRNTQWKAFLRKSFLDPSLVFSEVMQTITGELLPLYQQLESHNV